MQNTQLNNINPQLSVNNEGFEEDKNPIKEPAVFQKTAWKEPSLERNRSIEELTKKDFTISSKKTSIDDSDEDRPLIPLVFSSDEESPRSPVLTFLKIIKTKEKEERGIKPIAPHQDLPFSPLVFSNDSDEDRPLTSLIFSSDDEKPRSVDLTSLDSLPKREKRKREISPFDQKEETPLRQYDFPSDEGSPIRKTLFESKKMEAQRPPEAPKKNPTMNRRRPVIENETPFELKIISINKSGTIERNSKKYPVEPIENARGSYMQVYKITAQNPQLVDGIPNHNIIVKTFHEQTPSKNKPLRLENFMRNSIAQYQSLLAKGNIPIAKIYNVDTAIKDQYYIMEYLPNEVSTSSWKNPKVKFVDLPADLQKLLREVRNFMELMLNESIDMDLQPNNFRLNDQGLLFLIDFTEEPMLDPIHANLSQALRLWSNENQNICNFLKENLNHENFKAFSVKNSYME